MTGCSRANCLCTIHVVICAEPAPRESAPSSSKGLHACMSRKQLGARLLQRLGDHCASSPASRLRSPPCARDARAGEAGKLAIYQNLPLVLRKAAGSTGSHREEAMDFGVAHSLGPLPPAWWLQCSHRRAPLGQGPRLARQPTSRSFHTAYGDAAAVDRQASCSAMQPSSRASPASAPSHAAPQPKVHLNSAPQRRRSSMAATATQMAPPKFGGAPRLPAPPRHDQAPAQWVGGQDASAESRYTSPPPVNGSIVDAPALGRPMLAGVDAAAGAAAPGAVVYSGVVEGSVRHVTFRAADTGYTVLRVEATMQEGLPAGPTAQQARPQRQAAGGRGRKQSAAQAGLITVTGTFETLNKGQRLRFEGRWVEHPSFGNQLHASRHAAATHTRIFTPIVYLSGTLVWHGATACCAPGPKCLTSLRTRALLSILDS